MGGTSLFLMECLPSCDLEFSMQAIQNTLPTVCGYCIHCRDTEIRSVYIDRRDVQRESCLCTVSHSAASVSGTVGGMGSGSPSWSSAVREAKEEGSARLYSPFRLLRSGSSVAFPASPATCKQEGMKPVTSLPKYGLAMRSQCMFHPIVYMLPTTAEWKHRGQRVSTALLLHFSHIRVDLFCSFR